MKKILLLLFWFSFFVVHSQEKNLFLVKNKKISLVIHQLEKEFNIRFSYQDTLLKKKKISLSVKNYNLDKILLAIEDKTDLKFHKINNRYYNILTSKYHLNTIQEIPEITITNYLTQGISKKDNVFIVKPKHIGLLAGLTEADVFESLHQLPSVANINETATEITVRGGNTDQNNVLFDAIPIYHKGHLFGMISPINPNIVSKITLITKATNPKYNDKASSVVLIETDNKINNKRLFNFGLNGINFDANTNISILKNKLSLQTSIRRSFTEFIETPTFIKYEEKTFQTTKINIAEDKNFNFTDYVLKLNFIPNAKNQWYLSGIYITNNLDFKVKKDNNFSFKDLLAIKNLGFSLRWDRKWNSYITQETTVSLSDYNLQYKHTNFSDASFLGASQKGNQIYDAGLTSYFSYKKNKKNKVELGYRFNLKNASYAFKQIENTNSFVLDTDNSTVKTHQLFANFISDFKNFHVQIGSSINYYQELNMLKFAPRLLLTKKISKYFKLNFTTEFKNQAIYQIDETVLSDLYLENKIWRLANGKEFPVINSNQYSFGGIFVKNKWTFDMDLYYKQINGITALSFGYLNPDNPNFNKGKQKNLGLEFFAKKKFHYFNLWMSSGISKIENKFEHINNNNYFRASQELRYNGKISLSYKNNGFETAIAWMIHSGKPYTKASIDANNNFTFQKINNEQLPTYHRLDISSTYQFDFSKQKNIKGKIGLSIRNLYQQKNFISKEYVGNNSLTQPIKEYDIYGIGFTPNLLLRVWF